MENGVNIPTILAPLKQNGTEKKDDTMLGQ